MGLRGKKGSEKYYIIISLILGIMILALALYFIFNEYFTQDTLDWEACRQSVILRSGGVENNLVKLVQEEYPFKCKTEEVVINNEDRNVVMKEIADTMVQCWYTFGEGEYKLYADNVGGSSYSCFVCARIVFGEKVKENPFDMPLADYIAENYYSKEVTYQDYLYGVKDKTKKIEGWVDDNFLESVSFPQNINPNEGDLFILFANKKKNFILNFFDDKKYGVIIPQQGNVDKLDCDFETIPA